MGSNGKLPKGWREARIDNVSDVSFSSVDKKALEDQSSVLLCNYMDVWKNPYIHRHLKFMEATASASEIEKFTLHAGDVLLTKDSETKDEIAEPSVVREQIDNLVLGYHLALLRPKHNVADGQFLAAQLRIPEFRNQFIRAASGVTRYGLSMATVCGAKVWLPRFATQRKISGILRSVDEAIEATRAVIEQTRRLKTALLQEFFNRENRRGNSATQRLRLRDLGHWFHGGTPSKSQSAYWNGTIPWISAKDLKQADLWDSQDHISQSAVSAGARLAPVGTILMLVRGMGLAKAFPVGIARVPLAFNQDIKAIIAHHDHHPDYILYWFQRNEGRLMQLADEASHGTKKIDSDTLLSLGIELPSKAEQIRVASALRAVDDRIAHEIQTLAVAKTLKSALSQGLLTGRISVKGGN